MKQNELRPRIGSDEIDQQHRIRALDAGVAGMNLKRQVVFRAQLHQPPHDEVFEILNLTLG